MKIVKDDQLNVKAAQVGGIGAVVHLSFLGKTMIFSCNFETHTDMANETNQGVFVPSTHVTEVYGAVASVVLAFQIDIFLFDSFIESENFEKSVTSIYLILFTHFASYILKENK